MRFSDASMLRIYNDLKTSLQKQQKVSFEVINPDLYAGMYAGKTIEHEGKRYIYRGYKAWTDLAQLLFCRMLTPRVVNDGCVELTYERLNTKDSFHKNESGSEKYGVDSSFFQIHKNEEPAFLAPYIHALEHVNLHKRRRVLDLGINGGDEFALIKSLLPEEVYEQLELTGIDYCASAIAHAQSRFPEKNIQCLEADITKMDELNLGRFDVIISIGTFQSPSINFKPFFMSLVQEYLNEDGALILGFPNCRWMDGEMVYGAKVPNYSYSEMGMLYSDVMYCKKYLQQKKFRVTLTGKDYVFLTATKISKK